MNQLLINWKRVIHLIKSGEFNVHFGLVFMVVMILIGNYGVTNALATGWISISNL